MAKSSLAHAKSSGSTLYAVLSLNVLQSLDHDKIVALNEIGIFSLGDLLHFKPIIYAQILVSVSNRDIGHDISVERYLDNSYLNTLLSDIPNLPIVAIEGLGISMEAKFNTTFGITIIKELALFEPFIEAQQFLLPDEEVFNERPSAPEDLLPKILGSVHSIARFNSYIKSSQINLGNENLSLEANEIDELNSELYNIFTTNKFKLYTGFIAGFKQSWMNVGTHLGEIIHSLALAPGESRNISIIEWYRRQSSSRDEKTKVDERLSNSLVHSRALNEVVKTTAMEHLSGNTEIDATTKTSGFGITAAGAGGSSNGNSAGGSGNVSGTATDGVIGLGANIVGGFAKSALSTITGAIGLSAVFSKNEQVGTLKSESSGVRAVLGETQQNINDSTVQNSSNIRSLYSTIVVTDEQAETENIQTKNVTNYNHSHSLTIQYYEVLQRYEVAIKLDSWTPVVYLPFKPIFFDVNVVQKYWHLLRTPIISSFPELYERYNNFIKGFTPINPDFGFSQNTKVTKIKVTVSSSGAPYMYTTNSPTQSTNAISKPAESFVLTINQPPITGYPLSLPMFELPLGSQPNLSDLGSVFLKWQPTTNNLPTNPNDENTVNINFEFSLLDDNGNSLTVLKAYSKNIKIIDFFSAQVTPIVLTNNISTDVQDSLNSAAQFNSTEIKDEIEKHFKTYKYSYTRFLLSSIEGDQLSDIIESLSFDSPGTLFLENYIYTNPIAITENYLVFRHKKIPIPAGVNPCSQEFEGLNDPIWTALISLQCNVEEYKNAKNTKSLDTVFLPTAGVFAEAILGRSNASEFVDPRRFWNWQDSPIPFSAPQIAAITAGNHTVTDQSSSLTPNVPASNLNIINPQQYALPTTLSSALQAVQNGNMFRDMSKSGELVSILGNLATLASTTATLAGNLSGEAASNALNGAVELGKQVAGMVNKAADTWAAQSVAPPPLTPTDKAAALNVLKDIPSDKPLSKVDEAIAGVVGSNISEKPPAEKAKSILDNPQISDNIQNSDNFEYSNGEEKIKTEKKNNSQDVTDDIDSANRKEINEFIKRLKNGSFPTFDPSAFDGNNFQDLNNIENKLFIPDIANHTHFMILSMAGSRERSFNRQLVRDVLGLSTGLSTSTDLKFGYLALIDISKLLPSENGVYLLYDTGDGVEILESWGEQDINNHVIQIIYLTRAIGALKNITHLSLGYWGHGNYLGFQADDSLILHVQINKILQRAYEVSNYTSKFDIIFIDSCSNGMIELAFQLRDFSQVFIGSQFYIPGFGIAYRLLATMMDLVEPSNPQDWSRLFIESYKRQYNSIDNSLGLCAVDLSKVSSEIIPIIKSIVDTILSDIDTYIAEFKNIKSISTIVEDNGEYVGNDFFTIFDELNTKFPNTSLSISTSDVINKFRDALTSEPFIKLTKNNKSKVNGLSIFAPAKKKIFDEYSIYETLDFCQQTNWNLLLTQSF